VFKGVHGATEFLLIKDIPRQCEFKMVVSTDGKEGASLPKKVGPLRVPDDVRPLHLSIIIRIRRSPTALYLKV
jgi:hypothetical protein